MKFKEYAMPDTFTRVFACMVGESEISDSMRKSTYAEIFLNRMMERLACMVAAYFFKKHRTELMTMLVKDDYKEVKEAVAKRLVDNLKVDWSEY